MFIRHSGSWLNQTKVSPALSLPPIHSCRLHLFDRPARLAHRLLSPLTDYTKHFADPDVRLDWADVLQVIVDTTSALRSAATSMDQPTQRHGAEGAIPTCPICLSEPTAPRMVSHGDDVNPRLVSAADNISPALLRRPSADMVSGAHPAQTPHFSAAC